MKTKHLIIFLLLTALAPWTAEAQTKTHIANTASSTQMTWDEFAQNVNNGITYEGQTVYLDADITATTRAGYETGYGTSSYDIKSFQGTFDGQGHTLTFNYTADAVYPAPFACVKNATFLNLKITGTINANGKRYAGGFVGMLISGSQNCTFTNCESNVTINSTLSNNECRYGGFVANVAAGNVTFNGCAFTGKFSGTNAYGWGGFIGNLSTGHLALLSDCVFAPSEVTISTNNNATFSRYYNINDINLTNCYYTQSLGGSQGKQLYTVTAQSPATVAMNGTATNHNVSHITAYEGNQGLLYNDTIVAGEDDHVSVNLGGVGEFDIDHGILWGFANPYILLMGAYNTTISITPCIYPDNLQCTAFNANTATLAWEELGTECGTPTWQICLNGDEDNLIEADSNPFTLTGLNPGIQYSAKVRADYGEQPTLWSNEIFFQTSATLPYATDFETSCDWVLLNGNSTNQWCWGEAAHNGEGTHSLYISNNGGATNTYTFNRGTLVYAYKSFHLEPGYYIFSYDWRAIGENRYDYLRVALVPDTVMLEAGTTIPSGFSYNSLPSGWKALDGGTALDSSTEWQTIIQDIEVTSAGEYNMVFAWRNDSSDGANPPAAIDNVSIEASTCPPPTDLAVSNISTNSANLSWNGVPMVDSYTVKYRQTNFCFAEGFENGLGDWTLRNCSNGTGVYTYASHSGQNCFRIFYNTNPPQYLISPELSGVIEGMNLNFYYTNAINNFPETFQIGFSSTDNATDSFTFGDEITVSDVQWHLYSEMIPYGTKYICWKYTSSNAALFIDDIEVSTVFNPGPWVETPVAGNAAQMSATLAGLTPNTSYEALVYPDCDPDKESNTVWFVTETDCIYSTDFEMGCYWTLVNGSFTNKWCWGAGAFSDGVRGLYISSNGGTSNTFNTTTASFVFAYKTLHFNEGAYSITFDWRCYLGGTFRVALIPDSVNLVAELVEIPGFSSHSLPEGWIALDGGEKLEGVTSWQNANNDFLVTVAGNYKVTLIWMNPKRHTNTNQFDPPAAFDNVKIEVTSCPRPANLTVSNINTTTADLSWNVVFPTNSYMVKYKKTSETVWQEATVTDNGTVLGATLTGLTPETDYEVFVYPDCNPDKVSQTVNFTTTVACTTPTDLTVNDIGTTTATLNWTGGTEVDSYTVKYRTTNICLNQGFENGIGDWTFPDDLSNATIWTEDPEYNFTDFAHSGESALVFFNDDNLPAKYIISPELDGVFQDRLLEFYYRNYHPNELDDPSATFQVGFSSTDNATESFAFGDEITASDYLWHSYSVSIPVGTKYICLKVNNSYYFVLDDILASTNASIGAWQTTNTNTTNVTLTGLTLNTVYEAYVYPDCDPDKVSETITFTTEPQTTVTQTLTLSEGWNWVSLYVEGDPIDLLQALESALAENATQISSAELFTENDEGDWWGDLDEEGVTNEQMYMILVENACTIELEGIPANAADHTITINPGWNWIGFPCDHEMTIEEALGGFNAEDGDVFANSDLFTEFEDGEWFGDVAILIPGQGFMYYSNSDEPKTLIIGSSKGNRLLIPSSGNTSAGNP